MCLQSTKIFNRRSQSFEHFFLLQVYQSFSVESAIWTCNYDASDIRFQGQQASQELSGLIFEKAVDSVVFSPRSLKWNHRLHLKKRLKRAFALTTYRPRKTFVSGRNVMHQLDLVTDLLGSPSAETVARALPVPSSTIVNVDVDLMVLIQDDNLLGAIHKSDEPIRTTIRLVGNSITKLQMELHGVQSLPKKFNIARNKTVYVKLNYPGRVYEKNDADTGLLSD
ncbi:hypothetical protein L1987_06385 [Smallanthus sonchifolius]|uniref:Uncharacterized protein n=1 Tax=Smallanthus sonchifolius TaxID=185202 RepID=A0ACB9JY47_9ASTR|nr:hypothetical protein L1987_06385 [Smallanthus sonchifolius]